MCKSYLLKRIDKAVKEAERAFKRSLSDIKEQIFIRVLLVKKGEPRTYAPNGGMVVPVRSK